MARPSLATIELAELQRRLDEELDPLVTEPTLILEEGVSTEVVILPADGYVKLLKAGKNL